MSHPYGTLTDINIFKKFIEIIKKHSIKTFFETGTHGGITSKIMSHYVNNIITVDRYKFPTAEARLENITNVHFINEDSSIALADTLKWKSRSTTKDKILFFLDAHTSNHSEILKELEVISNYDIKPVIVCHDFYVPNNELLTCDTHQGKNLSLELIKTHLNKIYGNNGYTYEYNKDFDFHNPFVYLDIYDERETPHGDVVKTHQNKEYETAPGVIYIEPKGKVL